MKIKVFSAVSCLILMTGCRTPSSNEKPKQNTAQTTPNGQPINGQQTVVPGQPSPAAAGSKDLVVVAAIGDENPENGQKHSAFFTSLLTSVAQRAAGQDLKLGLIASPVGTVSKVAVNLASSGLDQTKAQQVQFELSAKDAFLGAMLTSCSAEQSDVNAPAHQAGQIKVCGQTVDIPAHSWSWTVDPLRGKLATLLRAGAQRTYVIVASNDVTIANAQQFMSITAATNGGKPPRVFVVAPNGAGPGCTTRNRPAPILEAVARSSGGKLFSYCQQDWGVFVTEIAAAI